LAAAEQAMQVEVHALLQQTESTQNPLTHCAVELQAPPFGFFAVQVPASQKKPDAQPASLVQVVGQLALVPPQSSAEGHAGSPGVPAEAFPHVPTAPVRSHRSHEPVHAVLQQTPSTQLPPAHWLPPVQVAPTAFFTTHAPPTQ
jgi:hypothetical protein